MKKIEKWKGFCLYKKGLIITILFQMIFLTGLIGILVPNIISNNVLLSSVSGVFAVISLIIVIITSIVLNNFNKTTKGKTKFNEKLAWVGAILSTFPSLISPYWTLGTLMLAKRETKKDPKSNMFDLIINN